MPLKALVIGSGLGGICTALRLQRLGYEVEIVEKHHQPGGRLNQLKKDGFTFDIGPSFFSMSYEFKDFADDIGIDMPFEFEELNPLYTINFKGSEKRYSIYKDLGKLAKEFEIIEPDFELKMEKFLKETGTLFHDTIDKVVKTNYSSLFDFIATMATVPLKHAPKMLRTVWDEMGRYFESDTVKQIFSLVAFFLGATPFDTPAVYTLLTYTEMVHDGYHNVKGGMYKIVETLMDEIKRSGIKITYNTEIVAFEEHEKEISAFIDKDGVKHFADLFVVNGDAAAFRGRILKREKFNDTQLDKKKWTMAPFTIYLGVKGKLPNINHHNYFLGNDFKDYSSKIFTDGAGLEQPYYYVNVLSKHNPESAPEGCESVFILCPVPDLRYKPNWDDRESIANNIISDLSERIGYNLSPNIITKTIYDPIDWQNKFNLYRGSGLGLAHDLNQIGAFRPKNYDEKFKNLFYVGASTTPGTGLPMVVISSKLVTERIENKYGSIH